jgi:hypothetical protein
MAKRTVLSFEVNNDIWPVVERWAQERKYREKARGDTWRRYQQGYGMLVAPKLIEVRQERTKVETQGWVHMPLINRIFTLFIMPAEMDLGSGFMGVVPRRMARRDLNVLLEMLGQPSIE